MARTTEEVVDNAIELGDDGGLPETPTRGKKHDPVYRIQGDSRIPVSKAHGKVWKSRQQQAMSKMRSDGLLDAWDEVVRYYRNDQSSHRYSSDGESDGSEPGARHMQRRFSETENLVFANTSALVPMLYAKNPTCEFTSIDQAGQEFEAVLERLINRLMSMRTAPGLNLKQKVRKAVVSTTLTNLGYMEVGYTFKEQSSEQAIADLTIAADALKKAKDDKEVRRAEGEIEALEERVELLRPSGPWCRYRRPQDVLIDPDREDEDFGDAKWLMIGDYVSTAWLNAVYAKYQPSGDQYKSVYRPTHVLDAGGGGEEGHNSAETEVENYTLLDDNKENAAKNYGYDDNESFRKAQRTRVWYVWDKITRRVYMYNDKDWSWPIWVWDDPYRLQGFFPLFQLQFYTDPEEPIGKSEVMYYLDQQDAINTINSEFKQARQWARRNLFYDKTRVSKDEVEAMLKGDNDTAIGVDVPDGATLKDVIMPFIPPSMQFVELFDKKPLLEAIDRVSSVQPVMRGVEFKTNTTNRAIEQYNSTQQTRTDEKIDAVEDFIGRIAWAVTQMCLQFMPRSVVAMLVGQQDAASWDNMSPEQIMSSVHMTVTGGSTLKPTTEAKKQQALNMGQVLGQFVNAAPQPVLLMMLNVMRRAFNDTIHDDEWKTIMEAVAQQGAALGGQGGGEGGQPSPANGAAQPQPQSQTVQQGDPTQQLMQMLDSLPPEAKQALGAAMAQGVPIEAALQRIIPAMQAAQGTA